MDVSTVFPPWWPCRCFLEEIGKMIFLYVSSCPSQLMLTSLLWNSKPPRYCEFISGQNQNFLRNPHPHRLASCPEGTSFPFPLPTKLPLWPPARKLQSNNRNWKNLWPSPRTVSQRKAYISWLVLHDSLQGRTKCLRVLTSPSFHWRLVFNCRHRRLWELCRRWSWFMLVQAIYFKN